MKAPGTPSFHSDINKINDHAMMKASHRHLAYSLKYRLTVIASRRKLVILRPARASLIRGMMPASSFADTRHELRANSISIGCRIFVIYSLYLWPRKDESDAWRALRLK